MFINTRIAYIFETKYKVCKNCHFLHFLFNISVINSINQIFSIHISIQQIQSSLICIENI